MSSKAVNGLLQSVVSNMLSVSPFLATETRFSFFYCDCWRCQSIQVSEWQGKATGSICASCFSDKTKQSMSLNCVIISAISWSHLRTSSKNCAKCKELLFFMFGKTAHWSLAARLHAGPWCGVWLGWAGIERVAWAGIVGEQSIAQQCVWAGIADSG